MPILPKAIASPPVPIELPYLKKYEQSEYLIAQVNNLHNFHAWSPWSERDPAAKLTFEGPTTGTGSS
jgi:hypothetical protein